MFRGDALLSLSVGVVQLSAELDLFELDRVQVL